MKNLIWIFSLLISLNSILIAQQEDPVLFYVEDEEVRVSEFKYIYDKNNRDSTKGTRESLADYLQLYVKFKLKVQAAKDAGLDTVKSLQDELNMYRQQLAKNYLLDKEIEQEITRIVHERMKEDLHLSHILLQVRPGEDTSSVIKFAHKLRDSILSGAVTFQEMALKYSNDGSVTKNKGDLGYLTAMFPNGFETLERAAYNLEEGEISKAIPSLAGYHLVKLHDRRPARGTVEISQILVRKPETGSKEMDKKKIEAAYQALENGLAWEQAVLEFTEDKKNRRQAGYLGVFEIGVYEEVIEDAAYALEEEGDYSAPIESSIGYHILKRGIAQKPQDADFESIKGLILAELEKTNRLDKAQEILIQKIKDRAPFEFYTDTYEELKSKVTDELTNYKWASPEVEEKTLLEFGSSFSRSNLDFINELKRNTRDRLRLDRKMGGKEALDVLLEKYISDQALEFEQTTLEEKYPDFKNLMREYREGILLFEITKNEIWDKAPRDTVGLKAFFEDHRSDFKWKERAKVLTFRIQTQDKSLMNEVKNAIMRKPIREVIKTYNKDSTLVTYSSKTIEKGDESFGARSWQEGVLSNLTQTGTGYTVEYIQEIIPAELKTLKEARGFVISDYQTYLEQEWIKSLGEKYRVKVVEFEFNRLVDSY